MQHTMVVKVPGQPAEVRQVEEGLEPLQQIVGGYIEAIYGKRQDGRPGRLVMICNEEGIIMNLPYCMEIWGHILVGTVIICSEGGDDFEGLEPEEAQEIASLLMA